MPPTSGSTLTLDGLRGTPTVFRTPEMIYDEVLSEAFLRQRVFAFDLAVNAVWAARAQ